jgi:N-acetylglucosaminyldiphosphoundecaprenol N-acetyl-beta-D-mannosaminyltransferase
MKVERLKILGVPVDNINMTGSLKYVDELVESNSLGNCIFAVNPEKVHALQNDKFLMDLFKEAALLIPDGIGVVLAMRLLFGVRAERVPGSELMPDICSLAADKGYRIFVYGAKEEVNKGSVEELRKRYPGINIVGRSNGYVAEEEMNDLIMDINKSQAQILFVALGSPRQEKWVKEYLPKLNVNICQGIGGTLDTITGDTRRAPQFFLNTGLEWFYRLVTNPKRIRRQIVLPIFALKVIKEKLRR